jgi:hypothetical protein
MSNCFATIDVIDLDKRSKRPRAQRRPQLLEAFHSVVVDRECHAVLQDPLHHLRPLRRIEVRSRCHHDTRKPGELGRESRGFIIVKAFHRDEDAVTIQIDVQAADTAAGSASSAKHYGMIMSDV